MKKYNHELMFEDMLGKRLLGKLYLRFFLYPILAKNISGRLLDLGSGLGDFCIYYKNSVAVDINKYSVRYCLDRSIEAKLIVDDKIPYKKETFDTLIMDNVLEHIMHPKKLLLDVNRVLKKKGRIIIGVPGVKGFKSVSDHKVFYDEVKLINLFHKFKLIKKFYTPFKSELLNKNLKAYCLFCVFEKV